MSKEKKHQKMDLFRNEIASVSGRNAAISSLMVKDCYDSSDELRLTILLQKASYLPGCETAYKNLIGKIQRMDNPTLIAKTENFAKKLNIEKKSTIICKPQY